EQGQCVAGLAVERLAPPRYAVLRVHAWHQVSEHCRGQALDQSPADERDQEERRGASHLDQEVLRGPVLQVRALQLLRDRRLALLDIPTAESVGGGLEEMVQRIAEASALR